MKNLILNTVDSQRLRSEWVCKWTNDFIEYYEEHLKWHSHMS